MNRTEQKEKLTDIITKIEDAISAVKNSKPFVEEVVNEFNSVLEKLEREGLNEVIELDGEQFNSQVVKAVLRDQANIEEIESDIDEFRDEIESYKDEISESRAEKLEERYADLDEVYDVISELTEDNEVTLEDVVEQLEEKVLWLKTMKK